MPFTLLLYMEHIKPRKSNIIKLEKRGFIIKSCLIYTVSELVYSQIIIKKNESTDQIFFWYGLNSKGHLSKLISTTKNNKTYKYINIYSKDG